MIWKVLLFELAIVIVSAGVWLLAPLVGIESIGWRIVLILALILPPIAIIVWKFVSERQASKKLASAMSAQGAAHEDKIRPDRREEISELNQVFSDALRSLRKSRLGGGRGNALYALPWYMIIGPPAAGKSTALLRSGLQFPFTPGDNKGIRGVGGTRNCDWWFSDQAILLDTAGRYSTEDDDQSEWTAFLKMLRKYRRKQPLNGLIVAVSVGDLLSARTEEIEELAQQIRSRIDQVIRDLELSLPIYLLFTKSDLISGFVEFFGDLRKSKRAQVLGFTVPLTNSQSDIGGIFSDEFNLLVQNIRKNGLSRLSERSSKKRLLAFQFPLQMAAIKDTLTHFAQILLAPNPYAESPKLRGAYFCSGTQEGRPIDRVMSSMASGLGLREIDTQVESGDRGARKSYFLKEIFTKVLVPDKELAGHSEAGLKRRRLITIAALVTTIAFSAGASAFSLMSYGNNHSFLKSTKKVAKRSHITTPEDPRKVEESLKALERLGQRLDSLRVFEKDGVPLTMSFGLYRGDMIAEDLERLYAKRCRQAFVMPAGSELEATLIDISNDRTNKEMKASQDFDLLKAYLMVTDPKRLDPKFAAPILLEQWKKRLHPDVALKSDLLLSNAQRYLILIKEKRTTWLDRDNDLIRNVRHTLRGRDAEYRRMIGGVKEKDIALTDALRGKIQSVIVAKYKVPGVYTKEGWKIIRKRLMARVASGSTIEPWVLGEKRDGNNNARLKKRYFEQYIGAWMKFIRGLSINKGKDGQETLLILDQLISSPQPYKDLFATIEEHTNLPMLDVPTKKSKAEKLLPKTMQKGLATGRKLGADKMAKNMGGMTPMASYFQPLNELANPPVGSGGRAYIGGLKQYLSQLANVRDALQKQISGERIDDPTKSVDATVSEAKRVVKGLLAMLPGDLRRATAPLFYAPLETTASGAQAAAAQSASDSFSNELCAAFNEKLGGKYPFAKSSQDALMQDAIEFFGENGTLWSYYKANLENLLIRRADKFTPRPNKQVPSNVLRFINKSWLITRRLFPLRSSTPSLRFEVKPRPAILKRESQHFISTITLEVEGVSKNYRNGPSEQWSFSWKGQSAKKSRLLVRGANGLREELSFLGDWALVKLLAKAKIKRSGQWTTLIWSFKKGAIKIPMDIRTARTHNPLLESLLLECK